MTKRFYVTTPIYYINDVPHLGSAYTTIAADVMTRYRQLRGYDTLFVTGTDEHGLKIQRAAEARGLSPQALADEVSATFRETWPQLSCEADDFIRTSSARHQRGAQEIWKRIAAAGDIYLGHYEGLYCVGCEAYFTEKELKQPGNLCPIHNVAVEAVKEESYFFRLSKYGDRLLAFYDAHPHFVQPEGRRNEVLSFVKGGLQDLSVSRTTFRWGVPVPGNDQHVMWVWIDALSNYWTALQEPADHGKYWPASVHIVGKDILRFHAVYWPAFLMSAGFTDDQLPGQVLAHGFLTYGGQKMSKSLRNTVSPMALAQAVSPQVGVDTVRYCLMRSISFGYDGDFSIEDVLNRYATDLGNTLGNLLNRVHPFAPPALEAADYGPLEQELRSAMEKAAKSAAEAFDACSPTRALEAIWAGLSAANVYVDKAAPWTARKQDPGRVGTIVTTLAEVLEAASVMVAPVMPAVAAGMREQLGLEPLTAELDRDQWPLTIGCRPPGTGLKPGEPLFPRLDKARAAALLNEFSPPAKATEEPAAADPPPNKPTVAFDDFAKLDLRVGVVVAAEKVKKKDRLLALQVDVGDAEPRHLVAGIAGSYQPEAIVGRRVVVLCNLEPRKFGKGLVSEGMLLAVTTADGVTLLAVDGEPPVGSAVS
ncbi:MAG: methionine--tRNA ligase [Deltaproteobacteria bacterium]|nr:MAG: methionine--tRNA ligase [Deltaproteobacteria bacterium]